MPPKVVIDTNILLVSVSPKSKSHWLFQAFLKQAFVLCVTTDILNEYAEIFEQKMSHAFSKSVMAILDNSENVEFVHKYYFWKAMPNDPDDDKYVDCAVACNARCIVSHDRHFRVLKALAWPKVAVMSLEEFRIFLEA